MATINAARLLKWDAALGSLEAGKRADLLVVDGRQGDRLRSPDRRARDHHHARRDQRRAALRIAPPDGGDRRDGETRRVGSVGACSIHLRRRRPIRWSARCRSATRSERLIDALQRLPELSRRTRALGPMGARAAGPAADDGERWVLELDHEPIDGSTVRLRAALGMRVERARGDAGRRPPAACRSISIPLTVVDDARFPDLVRGQPNLPEHIRRELPRLCGA